MLAVPSSPLSSSTLSSSTLSPSTLSPSTLSPSTLQLPLDPTVPGPNVPIQAEEVTMLAEHVFTSGPDGRLVTDDPLDRPILAADSWLVRDERVRAIDRHRQRFFGACSEAAVVSIDQLHAFWQAALAQLPRTGNWFPRVELCADAVAPLRLRIRPAPPIAAEVGVWICDTPDPRTVPRRKGPDLGTLARVRARAAEWGAQEALLTAESGVVLEAASSSVIWWDGDDLCLPSPTLPTLPGVTAGLIRERAERTGIRVAFRRASLAELDDCEVWLVNALHGIRPVTEWLGSARQTGSGRQVGSELRSGSGRSGSARKTRSVLRPGTAGRAASWASWLTGLALPLPTSPVIHPRQAEVAAGW
jgi:branched-subunit amino acid aminotransferase/4-amino-4-deoxychorismate lyase